MNISPEILELADAFGRIAREELLSRRGRLDERKSHRHSDGSWVTEADMASERRLIDIARYIFPGVPATGEEEICENPSDFFKKAQRGTVIIFDPLDGTSAFRDGRDTFGIMGAVIQDGKTVAGIIHAPMTKRTVVTELGKGCWLRDERYSSDYKRAEFKDRQQNVLESARVAFACRNQDAHFENILAAGVLYASQRCHAHDDYLNILCGYSDTVFYAEGFMPDGTGKCPPWDHAAGVLAIQEAGGHAALPYGEIGKGGEEYTPLQCHSSLLVAANRALFDDMMQHVNRRAPELLMPR